MGKYSGYLIASDLDGTLINSQQTISKENIDAVSAFVKEGGLFAIATGRAEYTAMAFINQLEVNCPCILYNGAVSYDIKSKSYIRSILLNKIKVLDVLKTILGEYENLCMQIFTLGKTYIVSGNENIDPILLREGHPFELAAIDDILSEDWVKVLMSETNETLNKVQQLIDSRIPTGTIHTVFSSATYLEVFAGGVSKGSMLESLVEITGIRREKAIAIGDYCNDIEMLIAAGLGVATANGHPQLKAAADITTVSNDEHAISNLIRVVLPIYSAILEKKEAFRFEQEKEII